MRAWVDNREDPRFIQKGKKIFPNLMVTQLNTGDVIIEDNGKYVCIEHKEGADFEASIKDKRLSVQPINMVQNFDYSFVFIEGGYLDIIQQNEYSNLMEESYNGKIASLAMKYITPPITVDDSNHFWRMAKVFGKRLEVAGEPLTKPIILPNKNNTLEMRMMMCFKGMGEKKASEILKKFDFWSLPEVTTEELMSIKGIGEIYANKIKGQIRKRWF